MAKTKKVTKPKKAANVKEDVYEVENILDKRETSKGIEYYVKWRGYCNTENTWEPADNILSASLIKAYETKRSTPAKVTPAKGTPAKGTPAKGTPSKSSPSKSSPSKSSPSKSSPSKSSPTKESPTKVSPVKTAKDSPLKSQIVTSPAKTKPKSKATKAKPKAKSTRLALAVAVTPIRSNIRFSPPTSPENKDKEEDGAGEKEDKESEAFDEEFKEEAEKLAKQAKKIVTSTPRVNRAKATTSRAPRGAKAASVKTALTPVRKVLLKKRPKKRSLSESSEAEVDVKETKKAKDKSIVHKDSEILQFKKFKFASVINESIQSKMVTIKGTYNNETAVIRFEKTPLDHEALKKALSNERTEAKQDFSNDIYSSYLFAPHDATGAISSLKATVICPANETVLAKYAHSEAILFTETPDLYQKVVEPYIEGLLKNQKDYNNWVYNILEGKSEADRLILNDPNPNSGFVITPDLKWAGDEKDLHLIAICHRHDIRSLRDLNSEHLVLLKNIMTKGTKAIKDKFKKNKGQLRSYIHYHPSFYHFHVHFRMVDASDYSTTDRDNLLSTVISNISIDKDYYKKSTLTYPLSLSSALYQELKKVKRK